MLILQASLMGIRHLIVIAQNDESVAEIASTEAVLDPSSNDRR